MDSVDVRVALKKHLYGGKRCQVVCNHIYSLKESIWKQYKVLFFKLEQGSGQADGRGRAPLERGDRKVRFAGLAGRG